MEYIRDKGIKLESEYPYKAKYQGCLKNGGSVKLSSYEQSARNKCGNLRNLVRDKGPVAVALDATNDFSDYSSGVLKSCSFSGTNHAVLVYGYDEKKNWLIKNSWGTSWGVKGTMRLRKGNCLNICSWGGTVATLA
jgi:cathepsin L